ncbi:hypothetical protein LZC95_20445 [Pendulispora brunnea]|uniref:UspA domain-containing protein n=1 Tax=Pendulispora brunnea TaxID=2905690 RepID=A0ABZ2KKJ1_9BACT
MQRVKLLIDFDVWLSTDDIEGVTNALADRANDAIAADHRVQIVHVKVVTSQPANLSEKGRST